MIFPHRSPLCIAVLISGGGTTLRNFIEKIAAGVLDVEIKLVISSTAAAGGLQIADRSAIPAMVVNPRGLTPEAFSEAMFGPCRAAEVDFVVMGGFVKHVLIPLDFENHVVNIHPALIPSFCGQGFYGQRVHQAVLDYGAKVSGCTVHLVDNQYDHGPIILQQTVPVLDHDTPESLAARVFESECEAYPEALRRLASGRYQLVGRRVVSAG